MKEKRHNLIIGLDMDGVIIENTKTPMVKTETKTKSADEKAKVGERAVGRRKTAAARIRLTPGTGVVTVNGKPLATYFPVALWQKEVLSPLTVTGKDKAFDISAKVVGGGLHGQALAVRHGITRVLIVWNAELKPVLKAEGYTTRDPRAKERKKFGKHRARRGHQWRKR